MFSVVSGKDDLQVSSCGTLVGNFVTPFQREFWKERQEFIIENHNDVRSAVTAEFDFKAAAAIEGTSSRFRSGISDAPGNVQSGKSKIQFFVKGKVGILSSVVREGLQEVLGRVIGESRQGDMHGTVGGRWVDLNSTLSCCGIKTECTVFLHYRLCGGSRENVPGQWSCSYCNAQHCWFVRTRCFRCGEHRMDAPAY